MTIPSPTCIQCDHLTNRHAPQQRRPQLITATGSLLPYRPSTQALRSGLASLLQRRAPCKPRRSKDRQRHDDLLINLFGSPQGAGLIGPGAEGLERAALVEAINRTTDVAQIVIEYADLDRLLGGAFTDDLERILKPRLYPTRTLEDAIEHIESSSEVAPTTDVEEPLVRSPVLAWFTTPGRHADVVHQTLKYSRTPNLAVLVAGPWAYGARHLIEADGPWKVPRRSIKLLSAQAAARQLTAET